MADWTTFDERSRLAAGRRRYNKRRQMRAECRRLMVARMLRTHPLSERGTRALIARELNVSRATISRDINRMVRLATGCPECRGPLLDEAWLSEVSSENHRTPTKRTPRPIISLHYTGPNPLESDQTTAQCSVCDTTMW